METDPIPRQHEGPTEVERPTEVLGNQDARDRSAQGTVHQLIFVAIKITQL